MDDLVSKKVLIKDIENIEAKYGNDNSSLIEQGEVLDLITEAHTVDIEPIRHGHWIYTDYCVWVCSECRENPTRGLGFVQAEEHLYEYCPRCGAKMDEEVSDG